MRMWQRKLYQKNTLLKYNVGVQATLYAKERRFYMATKTQSLAHTKWLCKYHIVFTPKNIDVKLYIINIEIVHVKY